MTKEALTQLREVHAIQGRDGCWDIDDYMLGLYNGLELALSIVENRTCKYKQRPKPQPEQEPVAIHQCQPLYTHPVKDLEDIDINITWNENSMRDFGKDELNFARAILRKAQEK